MTAESVAGVKVLATEPVYSPLSTPERPMPFKQTVRLLLENGTEMFGCIHCDNAESDLGKARAHVRKHAPKVDVAPDLLTLSLGTLLDMAGQSSAAGNLVLKHVKERDEWKRRALAAERKLSTLRGVFGDA